MNVTPQETLQDYLEKNRITQARLAKILQTKSTIREFPSDFNKSACRIDIPIGNIIPAIPFFYPNKDFPKRMDNPIATMYTSLIIDTRGLEIQPMIFPVIYNIYGLEVYNKDFINIRRAQNGIVSFCYNEDEAMKKKMAGNHPYFSVAIKNFKGCPIIAENDIKKIFSHKKTVEKLKNCRVIFIIDKKKDK